MIQIRNGKTHLPKINKKESFTNRDARGLLCDPSINNIKDSRSSRKFGLISAWWIFSVATLSSFIDWRLQ